MRNQKTRVGLDVLTGSSCNIQIVGTNARSAGVKMWFATVEFMRALDSITLQFLMARFRKMLYRITIHQLVEDAIRGTERGSLDRQRKRHVRDNEGNETGWSFDQLVLQHGAPNDIWKCCGRLAKKRKAWACVWEFLCLIASQTSVLLTTCSYSLFRWCTSKKWCATSSRVPRVQDWTSTRTRRTFLSKQRTNKSNKWIWTTLKLRLSACESATCLGQTSTFQQLEKQRSKIRIRACPASCSRYKQELASRSCFL